MLCQRVRKRGGHPSSCTEHTQLNPHPSPLWRQQGYPGNRLPGLCGGHRQGESPPWHDAAQHGSERFKEQRWGWALPSRALLFPLLPLLPRPSDLLSPSVVHPRLPPFLPCSSSRRLHPLPLPLTCFTPTQLLCLSHLKMNTEFGPISSQISDVRWHRHEEQILSQGIVPFSQHDSLCDKLQIRVNTVHLK